jgi:4-oxalocrotonate tautomerase family enzyme
MPIVSITILPQSAEKKAEMAVSITNEIHRITGIPKPAIVVAIYEVPAENCATNGVMVCDQLEAAH